MIRTVTLAAVGMIAIAVAGCAGSSAGMPGGTASADEFLRTGARTAVVDFFDMYCHTCQSSAAHVNQLHALAQRRGLGSEVAFYAVGWGNTPMEAELYRSRFRVPFPVIPDPGREISRRYGEFRPPLLLVLRREGGAWREVYRTKDLGAPPEQILDALSG